jgi:hypothetical protein
VTITLTPTIIPTQTPQPPSPAFLDLQEKVAKSDIYTLTPNGIEMKNEDGTITLVPDIKPNIVDGTLIITYEGNEYLGEFVSIDGQILTFKDKNGNTFIFNGENLVQTLSQEQLDQMTDEEKLKKAPEKMADLTKSNISTVKNNLVIYRDSETNAQKVFDLLTGKELTLPEAGIIEFKKDDGGKIEMLSFDTIQNALDYMVNIDGVTYAVQSIDSIEGATPFFNKLFKIPDLGNNVMGGVAVSVISLDTYIRIMVYDVGTGTILAYVDDERGLKSIYVNEDAEEIKSGLLAGRYSISITNLTPTETSTP